MVGGQRRDAAPVVDTGAQQQCGLGEVDEVGRRLHAHPRAHHDAGHRDRGEVLLQRGVRHRPHGGVVLGTEVLDDHLLHVAVPAVRGADREDGLGAVAQRLADADEQAGGERDGVPPGVLEHAQAHLGVLVRRAVVRLQASGRLEHHPH